DSLITMNRFTPSRRRSSARGRPYRRSWSQEDLIVLGSGDSGTCEGIRAMHARLLIEAAQVAQRIARAVQASVLLGRAGPGCRALTLRNDRRADPAWQRTGRRRARPRTASGCEEPSPGEWLRPRTRSPALTGRR